ncbi:MAG: OB-fold nucleic acid binding domain-containing protein, partial [Candidatus Goldbacteria bacterium]|nr:OB-fold nucleic acid binding domain-containing protein [Candidatus Goldiibacteriota bacterium]
TAVIVFSIILILFLTKRLIIDELKNIKSTSKIEIQTSKSEIDFKSKQKQKISWKEANKYIGEYIETDGVIVSSYNNGKVCFLNFHKDYKKYLTLVIFASDFKKFPDKPEKYYLGKNVKVEGRVKEYQGRPEIIIKTADQIKILN